MTRSGESGLFWRPFVACVLCLCLVQQVWAQSLPVNVALNKPITARITCGLNRPESFSAHSEGPKLPADRVMSTCDASIPSLAHGPENMVDSESGEVYTWWQSTSRNQLVTAELVSPDTEITIDLLESYRIERIQIQMGDSVRPNQMAVFKSIDGISFIPWQYQVTSSSECTSEFASPFSSTVSHLNSIICTRYSSASMQPGNEVINFNPTLSSDLVEWQRARYVRFNFYNMERSFGYLSDLYHHYTVRNINILARCECNGHASDCTLQPKPSEPTRMTYQCECGGNTQGATCDQCLPFYNQLEYQTGGDGFTCQACNCFGHSRLCTYDPIIASTNSSLDAVGMYNGGGVCQDCQNFTAGINCHECQTFYFRPSSKQQSDRDACQPCECNLPGTRADPSIGLVKGQCIMNNDNPTPNGMMPGDCFCKINVRGSKCDGCADGFYDLTDANSNGCLSCNCFTQGTVQASNICNKDVTGQCPCKNFTTGRRCDQCMDGYYGLATDNPEGCLACSCDTGGAFSSTCDKQTGNCACRSRIEGRQCNSLAAFSYYPTLHSISAEFETVNHPNWGRDSVMYPGFRWYGYVTLTGQMSTTTTLSVPPSQLSGTFQIILRAANVGATQVGLTISPRGVTGGTTQIGTVNLPLCPSWCFDGRALNADTSLGSKFSLSPGEWDVMVTVNLQGGATVLFDQVVALPAEFIDPSPLLGDTAVAEFTTTCDVYNNDMRLDTSQESFCLSTVFSLTAFYFNGVRPCDCNPTGSTSLQCELYAGRCQCKPGVGGRTCDMCLPEFYAFRSTGCTACNCFGDDKVCDMTTGLCDCPPNTAGQRCDRCVIFAWGLDSTNGCKLCNCDPLGSVNPQCDATSGECTCHPGVGGSRCHECQDGYKGLTATGCTPCQCDAALIRRAVCDKVTSQCPCKELAEGLTCSNCAPGSFFKSAQHPTGCLQCVCMGITTVCDSTQDKAVQYNIATDASLLSSWSIVSDPVALSPFPNAPITALVSATTVISITVPSGQEAYWTIPLLPRSLLGLYGSQLQFSLYYTVQGPPQGSSPQETRIFIKGQSNTFTHSLGTVQPSNLQDFTIQVTETEFEIEGTNTTIDRGDFLKTLSSVDAVFISASLANVAHQSSIGRVSYFAATSPSSPLYDSQATRALSVEQCSCGRGYAGYSCESCAPGYHRVNVTGHPYFGECAACECNGHSELCDPVSGQCLDCGHNTTGSNCEQCAAGFYGDATMGTANDCTACPCRPPKAHNTSCAVIDDTLTCLACSTGHLGPLCDGCEPFHYGQPQLPDGFCTPCFCHGNTNQCDTITGRCLGCASRTTGLQCERCQDFTFGNASLRNCQDCNCDPVGSNSSLCDHSTGQCPCRPGVGNRRCNTCLPNYYGLTSQGCQACDCNRFGSLNLQCGDDGVCSCLVNVIGAKCDQCMMGRYGLPHQPCANCDCDVRGSLGGATAVCDVIRGQCPCKDGVGSRRCDQCLPVYVNFSNTGCSRCDQCVETLQNSTIDLSDLWTRLWQQANILNDLQQRGRELDDLRPRVNRTVTQLTATLTSFDQLRLQIEGIDEQQVVGQVDGLVLLVGQALEDSQTLLNDLTSQLDRIQGLKTQAQAILDGIHRTNQTALTYVNMLSQWNTTATSLLSMAQVKLDNLVMVAFSDQERLINAELARSQNVSRDAEALLNMITSQASSSNALSALVSSAETRLSSTMQHVADTQSLLDSVEASLRQVDMISMEIETQLNYSSQLISQSQSLLQRVNTMLVDSLSSLADGDIAFAEADIIRVGSTSGSAGVPVDQGVDKKGQNGWVAAQSAARTQNNVVSALQTDIETEVLLAESRVGALTIDVQEANRLFMGAQTHGQQAVDVIKRYQDTVASINQADVTSQEANRTISATQRSIEKQTLTALQQDGRTSKENSSMLEMEVSNRNTDVTALEDSLQTANETLISAQELWDSIAVDHTILQQEANALSQVAQDPQIQPAIDDGLAAANLALGISQLTLNNTETLTGILMENDGHVQRTNQTIYTSMAILEAVPTKVNEVELTLNTVTEKTNTLASLQNETSQIRPAIDERLARLRAKLRSIQNRIAQTKQPARFPGGTSLEIQLESSGQATLSNEVQADFKADQPDGLVLSMDNTAGHDFSLQLVGGKLQFGFTISQDEVLIQSPIDVCCGEWYHVLATRYANEGQLSVVKLNTGGASTTYNRSRFTYDRYFTFPANKTSYYIGGTPTSNRTFGARSIYFEGCISDVSFDGQELNLWRPTSQQGSTLCCQAAIEPVTPEPKVTPGASFSGFGFFQIPNNKFDVYQGAVMSLDFQTTVPESVLFIVTRLDLISYIGIFMKAGNIMFEMNTAGNARYILMSRQSYNDGRWYRVTAAFNTSHYRMDISYANQTDVLLESFEQATLAPLIFSNLRYAFRLMLGSPDPVLNSNTIRGPTNLRFAGCMNNVKLSNGTSTRLVNRPLNSSSAVGYDGVTFHRCKADVTAGVGFSGDFAFAQFQLASELRMTRSISFSFKTLEPHGILAYSYSTRLFNKLFYITLYHGNLFVQYNVGEGLSEPLQTVGLRLNTGQWQDVTVRFVGLSATLKVNDLPTIYSVRHLQTEGISIEGTGSFLYVGGVPRTTPLLIGGEYPVRRSLSGDLKDFMINSHLLNFNDVSVVVAHQGLDLSGVPQPVADLPPLPYATQPTPNVTASPGSCSDPITLISYPGAVRFGARQGSFQAYRLSQHAVDTFRNSFVIELEFRAVSSNGVLLYAASSTTNPREFIGLVMLDGKLSFSILTNSRAMTGFDVASRGRYDNAQWQKVTVLRINDFVAILVEAAHDYTNNKVASDAVLSTITINTDLYVGGIGSEINTNRFPFGVSEPFDGCIRNLVVDSGIPPKLNFDLSAPARQFNVANCSMNEMDLGGFFDGSGWLLLRNNFVVGQALNIRLTVRTSMHNALLVAVAANSQNFLAVDIYNGMVRAIVSHGSLSSYIVRSTTLTSEFALCDNKPHTIDVSLTSATLALKIDDYARDVTPFDAGTPNVATNNALYIGGIPDTTTVPLIDGISSQSFKGCIQDFRINNSTVSFSDNQGHVGFTMGCPRPAYNPGQNSLGPRPPLNVV